MLADVCRNLLRDAVHFLKLSGEVSDAARLFGKCLQDAARMTALTAVFIRPKQQSNAVDGGAVQFLNPTDGLLER